MMKEGNFLNQFPNNLFDRVQFEGRRRESKNQLFSKKSQQVEIREQRYNFIDKGQIKMKESKDQLRKIIKKFNDSDITNSQQNNKQSYNLSNVSLNASPRGLFSQNQQNRIKNNKSNSSFTQNFNFHYPASLKQSNSQFKKQEKQSIADRLQISKFFQDQLNNSQMTGKKSPLLNPNQSCKNMSSSQSYFIQALQTNPSSPQNQNMISTGFSYNSNQPQLNAFGSVDVNKIFSIPKLNLSKQNLLNISKQKNKSMPQNCFSNQQEQQKQSQIVNYQQKSKSTKPSPSRQQDYFSLKFKSLPHQKIVQNLEMNKPYKVNSQKYNIFSKFTSQRLRGFDEAQKKQYDNEQDKTKQGVSFSNGIDMHQTNNSINNGNGSAENNINNNTPQQQQQINSQLQQSQNQASNCNNFNQLNNLINGQSRDQKGVQRKDSENDLFSTSRKEHRMIELMKQKLQQNQLLNIIIPKFSEKMITGNSYLTSKLNPYYEKTMNLVNDIENKKLRLGDDYKQNNHSSDFTNSQYISTAQSPASNSYQKNNDWNSEQEGYYNYIEIKNQKTEPVELVHKQNCQNVIHAESLEFFYVYVNVKAMPTPVRVSFKTPISKLKVFISKSTPYPSKFSNDYILQSNIIRVDDGSNKQFSFDKLYFGILSEIEQDIKISIKYGSEKRIPVVITTSQKSGEHSEMNQTNQNKFSIHKGQRHISTPVLAQDVAEIKERRRKKILRISNDGIEKDFCQENINYIACFTPDSHKNQFHEKLQQFNSKHKEVIEKKRLLDEQLYFKKDYLLKCREFQKQINNQYIIINDKKREATKISNQWAKLVLQIIGLQILHKKIKRKSNLMKTVRDAKFKLKFMIANIKNKVAMGGINNIENRTIFNAKNCMKLYAKSIRNKAKIKAGQILANILAQRKEFYLLNTHLRSYVNTINMIINRWRQFRTKKENFSRMLGFLFDKYFSQVLETISKNGSEINDFFSVITNARRIDKVKTETTRKKFIECYLERRRVEYTQDLYKYFAYFQSHNKKFLYLQILMKKRKDEEIDFNENKFEYVNEDREKEIEKFLFDQVINKKRAESLQPPRYFIVPTYEVLKQVVCETFVKVKDEAIVKKLREEKIKKNWSETTFLKKLIQNDDDIIKLQKK